MPPPRSLLLQPRGRGAARRCRWIFLSDRRTQCHTFAKASLRAAHLLSCVALPAAHPASSRRKWSLLIIVAHSERGTLYYVLFPTSMAKKKNDTEKRRQRLVLLDSHAILHRAYHAIPDFSSSKGEPTGALYGLTSMLLKLIQDLRPDYIVAARDLPGPTVRHELFEAYKAKR